MPSGMVMLKSWSNVVFHVMRNARIHLPSCKYPESSAREADTATNKENSNIGSNYRMQIHVVAIAETVVTVHSKIHGLI